MNNVQKWLKTAYENNRVAIEMTIGATVFVAAIAILTFVCLIGGNFILDQTTCNAQTAEIGFPHRWGLWTGCQIEVTEGQWIPLESYRYTSPID